MPSPPTKRPGEVPFALVLVVFSATALWQAHAISGFAGLTTAGVFPMLASGTMLVSAVVILVSRVLGRSAGRPAIGPAEAPVTRVLPPVLIVVVGMVAAYVALLPLIGFVPASGLFLFAAFAYLWRRGWLVSLALTALSLAVIYAVFRLIFQVVLPGGSLLRVLA